MQSGLQLSSQVQLQQRGENSLNDHHKVPAALSNDSKVVLSSVGQSTGVPAGDASGTQKVCFSKPVSLLQNFFPNICS